MATQSRKRSYRGSSSARTSAAGIARARARRKKQLRFFEWQEIDKLRFPGYFTACHDYYATGEGRTRGITLYYARSGEDLRKRVERDFDAYFARGVEIRRGLNPPQGCERLVAPIAQQIMDVIAGKRPGPIGSFHFTAGVHENYS